MQHSRKYSQGFLWGNWQLLGNPSRTSSLLPAGGQTAHGLLGIPLLLSLRAVTPSRGWALTLLGLQPLAGMLWPNRHCLALQLSNAWHGRG